MFLPCMLINLMQLPHMLSAMCVRFNFVSRVLVNERKSYHDEKDVIGNCIDFCCLLIRSIEDESIHCNE